MPSSSNSISPGPSQIYSRYFISAFGKRPRRFASAEPQERPQREQEKWKKKEIEGGASDDREKDGSRRSRTAQGKRGTFYREGGEEVFRERKSKISVFSSVSFLFFLKKGFQL